MTLNFEILERATTINIDVVLSKVFKRRAVKTFIENLNKKQLKGSVDANNERLSYIDAEGNEHIGYSPSTAKSSRGKKKVGEPYNLFDTGEFYKSIKAIPELNGVDLISNPIGYDVYLYRKFGNDIVGLTQENILLLQEFIKPIFQKEVRKYLQIN